MLSLNSTDAMPLFNYSKYTSKYIKVSKADANKTETKTTYTYIYVT